MKIGILTSSIAGNYGGILQNYALQQVLKLLGHEPVTIDHYKSYSRMRWIMGRVNAFLHKRSVNVPFPWYGRVGEKSILDFGFKNIDRTKPVKEILPDIIDKYGFETLIVGSDQVWRKKYNKNIETNFLSFAENKKVKRIAYAASFGIDVWDYPEDLTGRCQELLARFDAVSVREKSDIILCRENLNVVPTHVLDPTLLLSASHYENFFVRKVALKDKYLFAYVLDKNEEKLNYIRDYSHQMCLVPIIMGAENNAKNGDSIEKWLTMIDNASFVITDSYHGTLFSIIFNKEFMSINNAQRGNSRFESILGEIGLMKRLVDTDALKVIILPKIDWNEVNSIIENGREKSLSFLKTALL